MKKLSFPNAETEFLAYQHQTSNLSVDNVIRHNDKCCYAYGQGPGRLANPLSYYSRILYGLSRNKRLNLVHVKDLMGPIPSGKSNLALRHDIDCDIKTALSMSQEEKRLGIPSTYYILTTSEAYYGVFEKGIFYRNECLAPFYLTLQKNGAEVGLHNNGLMIYIEKGIDGAEGVKEELAWLRGTGLLIAGSSGHNSAPFYGAENFELFMGRAIWGRTEIVRNGRRVPLQTLDERKLGLEYEANYAVATTDHPTPEAEKYLAGHVQGDVLRQASWFKQYALNNPYCTWGSDFNIWLLGQDAWCVSGHPKKTPQFDFKVVLDKVLNFLNELPNGSRIVCHIHPIYVGWRSPSGIVFNGKDSYWCNKGTKKGNVNKDPMDQAARRSARDSWKDKEIAYEDAIASFYDDQYYGYPIEQAQFRDFCRFVMGHSRRHDCLLDLGAGTGLLASFLIKKGYQKVILADISFEMVKKIREKVPTARVLVCEGEALPFKIGTFDVVVCSSILHHLPKLEPFLVEVKRVLNTYGLLLTREPNRNHFFTKPSPISGLLMSLMHYIGRIERLRPIEEPPIHEFHRAFQVNELVEPVAKHFHILEFYSKFTVSALFNRVRNKVLTWAILFLDRVIGYGHGSIFYMACSKSDMGYAKILADYTEIVRDYLSQANREGRHRIFFVGIYLLLIGTRIFERLMRWFR